jgi:hypothetical protein
VLLLLLLQHLLRLLLLLLQERKLVDTYSRHAPDVVARELAGETWPD